ncbi:MAG: serine/threonine-protein kinase [Planctomycetota bacterium]
MTKDRKCPKCSAPLSPDAPEGLCPKCLLAQSKDSTYLLTGAKDTPKSATDFDPPSPEELGRYFPQLEVLGLLGKGGMGAVYKARQTSLDRLVALKVLPPNVAKDPTFAERFSREAKALAKLGHPNIVMVHDFGQAGDYYYFLMEYVDGVNLRQAIKAKALPPREALKIVTQICDALQFAHEEGVVHRDIKPENILLDKKGNVKIADFGLAKLIGVSRADFTLTGTGQVMGTPHYMAPEQMEKPLEVDQRSDIYSLGVVFYEMLTGELPMGRFAPPSQKVQVDVRIDEVVLRTLEREPARRYQSAGEVKTQVERISQAPRQPERGDVSEWAGWWVALSRPATLLVGTLCVLALIAAACIAFSLVTTTWKGRTILRGMDTADFLRFGPMGPTVSKEFSQTLDLRPMEEEAVNKALQEAHRKYVALEEKHTKVFKDDQGHVHVTVSPFSADVKAIEKELWSKIDVVLDERQRAVARRHLPLGEILPYGDGETTMEIWHEGLSYHWKAKTGGLFSRGTSSGSSPLLFNQYKRFWETAQGQGSVVEIGGMEVQADRLAVDTQTQKMVASGDVTIKQLKTDAPVIKTNKLIMDIGGQDAAVVKVKKAFRDAAVKAAKDVCSVTGEEMNHEGLADQIMLRYEASLAVTEEQAGDLLAGKFDDAGNKARIMAALDEFEKHGAVLPPFCVCMIKNVKNGKVKSGIDLEFYARVIAGHLGMLKEAQGKGQPQPKAAPPEPTSEEAALRKAVAETKVDVSFVDTPLLDVVSFLESLTGKNIALLTRQWSKRPITLELKQAPLSSTLDNLIQMIDTGAKWEVVGNVICIGSSTDLAALAHKPSRLSATPAEEERALWRIVQERRMDVEFENVPLVDVVKFLRMQVDCNMVIAPEVDEGRTVTLRVKQATFDTILRLICAPDLTYDIWNSAVRISPARPALP